MRAAEADWYLHGRADRLDWEGTMARAVDVAPGVHEERGDLDGTHLVRWGRVGNVRRRGPSEECEGRETLEAH